MHHNAHDDNVLAQFQTAFFHKLFVFMSSPSLLFLATWILIATRIFVKIYTQIFNAHFFIFGNWKWMHAVLFFESYRTCFYSCLPAPNLVLHLSLENFCYFLVCTYTLSSISVNFHPQSTFGNPCTFFALILNLNHAWSWQCVFAWQTE